MVDTGRVAAETRRRVLVAAEELRYVRSGAQVSTADLAPTLLDAAGLPVPREMQGHSLLNRAAGLCDRQAQRITAAGAAQ